MALMAAQMVGGHSRPADSGPDDFVQLFLIYS
jgi:hypothetical protein